MQSTRAWLTRVLILSCLALSSGVTEAAAKKAAPVKPPPPIPTHQPFGFFDRNPALDVPPPSAGHACHEG